MAQQVFLQEVAELQHNYDSLKPECELTVRDNDLGVEGYVVVWNTQASLDGPLGRCGKGGTRITPHVTLEEITMLARIMTLKNAAAGLPLGGAKSGLRADPEMPQFETMYRRFVHLCKPILVEKGGIFGGFGFDVGARPEHALWACDELGSLRSFTGKPLSMGGTDYDREGIAGYGVAVAAQSILGINNDAIKATSFAVQGLGAMGAAVYKYMHSFGAHPNFVSDPRLGGCWELHTSHSEELDNLLGASRLPEARHLLHSGMGTLHATDDILSVQTDVLFPCATQDVITEENASHIQAKYLVEGANNPCSPRARTILWERHIPLVPDIIANSGGIIAAFIEMTSTATPEENVAKHINPIRAKELTRERISHNVEQLFRMSSEQALEPSAIANYIALYNIFRTHAVAPQSATV